MGVEGTTEVVIEGRTDLFADIIGVAGDLLSYRPRWKKYARGRGYRPRWDDTFDTPTDYFPYTGIGASFWAMSQLDEWRIRGEKQRDYYRNTGYNPRYYSKLRRRRVKW